MKPVESPPKWRSLLLIFAGATVIALAFATLSYAADAMERRRFGFGFTLSLNLTRFYLWALLSPLILRFSYRFPIQFRPVRLRNLLHIPAIFLFAAVHQASHLVLGWLLAPALRTQFRTMGKLYAAGFAPGLYQSLIFASLIVVAAHAFMYYRNFRAEEVKQSELKAQLAQAQLQALKMQLQPHFLFNTLHSISSLVLEDPLRANGMIARLGDFLRLTLDYSEEQMVTLEQEIEFLRCYLEIEQERFQDRLHVDFSMDPATLNAQVPHLILQPIAENAIRHAIAPKATAGRVAIKTSRLNGWLRLEINDTGPGFDTNAANRGFGLRNVQNRLKQVYGEDYHFDLTNRSPEGVAVILEVPFKDATEH